MALKAFEEVHGDQTLRLPIRGKEYVVHPPRADVGKALSMQAAVGFLLNLGVPLDDEDLAEAERTTVIADEQLPDFAQQCLNGPSNGKPVLVYEEMIDDGLSQTEVEMAVQTAFITWVYGREAGEHYWNTGGKALAQRQVHPALRQTETPTPAAAASGTPTTASASGTRRKARAKAARSHGFSPTTTT